MSALRLVPARKADGTEGIGKRLSPVAEQEAWRRFCEGRDERAREALILHYAHLVPITRRRAVPTPPSEVTAEDLEGEGFCALIRAVETFDPDRGTKFASYAISVIRGAVREALRRADWVPRTTREWGRHVREAKATLEAQGRRVTDADCAELLGLSLDDYYTRSARKPLYSVQSLQDSVHTDELGDPILLAETLADPEADSAEEVATRDLGVRLAAAIARLPVREARVIRLIYWEEQPESALASLLGVSKSRCHQIHWSALARLRRLCGTPGRRYVGEEEP